MPKEEWGQKRVCLTTGKRFYDLNRTPIVSPYTGEVVDLESMQRKTSVSAVNKKAKEKPSEEEAIINEDDLLDDTADVELDDDLLEDDSDDTVSLDDIADVSDDDGDDN